jgi:integral membrane protein (TIGR01906 family)
MDNKLFTNIIRWLIIIAMPFLLAIFTVRSLIGWRSPGYPAFEYARIAPDAYGFTDQERLELANANLDYLQRSEPAEEVIYMLEDLRLPGTDEPLYNPDEISHMLDVKIIADAFGRLMWPLALVVIGGLAFLLARSKTRQLGYKTLMHGGLFTASILIVIGILLGVAWNFIFVQFHELLFPPGTWTFAYTDSLIRLFPEQFWFDFGVIWVAGILIQGIIWAGVGYWLNRRAASS